MKPGDHDEVPPEVPPPGGEIEPPPALGPVPRGHAMQADGKVLVRFSPQWTIEYLDPDLLASLKDWLRAESP